MPEFSIRRAQAGDEDVVLRLLRQLAEYEKLTHLFALTKDKIGKDFVGAASLVKCDLAYERDEPVGVAIWYWTYTTFAAAKGIYLEDLYVRDAYRGRGYGKRLLAHLAKQAVEHGAIRVEWSVLNWNKPSIEFYERLGARPASDWTVYRLSDAALESLARADA